MNLTNQAKATVGAAQLELVHVSKLFILLGQSCRSTRPVSRSRVLRVKQRAIQRFERRAAQRRGPVSSCNLHVIIYQYVVVHTFAKCKHVRITQNNYWSAHFPF